VVPDLGDVEPEGGRPAGESVSWTAGYIVAHYGSGPPMTAFDAIQIEIGPPTS